MSVSLSFEQWVDVLKWLVPAGAAWAALALSLYTWYQSRPRRRVDVALAYTRLGGEITTAVGPGIYTEQLIAITFVNEQGPVVVVEEVGFECADWLYIKKVMFLDGYDAPLPKEVSAGYAATYYFDLEDLRIRVQGGMVPLNAYCRDATGQYYTTPLSREIRTALLEESRPPGSTGSGSGGGGESETLALAKN